MPDKKERDLKSFLKDPEVEKVIASHTPALEERLNYKHKICEVFKHRFSRLENDPRYGRRT